MRRRRLEYPWGILRVALCQQYQLSRADPNGPSDGKYNRLLVPADARGFVSPSVEAQLNARQKRIVVQVQMEGGVTSGWCRKVFGVTYNTAYLDLSDLVDRGLLAQKGKGRATRYELVSGGA